MFDEEIGMTESRKRTKDFVQSVDINNDDRLFSFLTQIPDLPYAAYGADPLDSVKASISLFKKRLSSPKSEALGLEDKNRRLLGVGAYGLLGFDSKHFKAPMGCIDPIFISRQANEAGIRKLFKTCIKNLDALRCGHAYMRIPTGDLRYCRIAFSSGFYLADTSIEYILDFRKKPFLPSITPDKRIKIRMAGKEDNKELLSLTRRIFCNYIGRFHQDNWFDQKSAAELYVKWMKNSLAGELATNILVAELNGKLVGFITLKIESELEQIIKIRLGEGALVGVDPKARGQGIHLLMMKDAIRWFSHRVDILKMVTLANNFPPQNIWTQLGFKISSSFHTLHIRINNKH